MADEDPLTASIVSSLLHSPIPGDSEEDRHPWARSSTVDIEKPLLRTWDKCSGSKPTQQNTMLSRLPRQRLDTSELRRGLLSIHAKHKNWTATPFISFTQSSRKLQEVADFRSTRPGRGPQTITVINPNVRIANRLPILDMGLEMRYYGVPDPYNQSNTYYEDHYICLWEVTEPEIVGHWSWNELKRNILWFDQIVLPAFEKHNEESSRQRTSVESFDLSALLGTLPDGAGQGISNASSSPSCASSANWDTGSEGCELDCKDQYDSYDSYDEVVENNTTDDMFKILEGDWD
ncbi:hypothetical protein BDV24DRAFT_172194 [Aspergillus arachidicola]|uniref:Uncharacterized protein n=1 Tax=Aspergillus arachidicola TaxID=656916 RepID=A0A5N6XN28_9EURO|nr:hypothetical protein BDV24DRAFT_172194 [Aspergillus arachidicola]